MHEDTLGREIKVGDIVVHANTGKWMPGAYVGIVKSFSSKKVRIKFFRGHESSCLGHNLAIMRSDDIYIPSSFNK